MKRPQRQSDGHYHINGKKYKELFGSRIQVWNGNAYKTSGELTRKELTYNRKTHRIVSLKKHRTAKKEKRLEKYGFFAEKGKFGYVKKTAKRRRNLKKGGVGNVIENPENPEEQNAQEAEKAQEAARLEAEKAQEAARLEAEKAQEAARLEAEKAQEAANNSSENKLASSAVGGKKDKKRKQ
jgi:hypothetical protein